MSPNGFTLNYDLAMHTPEALKENVKAKLAEMNQQVVSTEPVSVNDSNFEEDNSTVTVDNKEISTSNEVVRTENTPTVVEVITSESKEKFSNYCRRFKEKFRSSSQKLKMNLTIQI